MDNNYITKFNKRKIITKMYFFNIQTDLNKLNYVVFSINLKLDDKVVLNIV